MSRELTDKEKKKIKKFVVGCCANYRKDYGCLPLGCDCYMLTKHFANDKICRYFRDSVLPLDPELEVLFFDQHLKNCKYCGKKFVYDGRKAYCSESCRKEAHRIMNAARVRKYREKKEGER